MRASARTVNAMNKSAAILGLSLVVLGALWLSGSSTLLLGVRQGVPEYALPSLLVVLEIASVVGTALWVTAKQRHARVRPVIVVVLSSSVAAIGGWLAYGPLGLVAPVAVVLVTDMIAERWSEHAHTDTAHVPHAASDETRTDVPAQLAQVSDLFPKVQAAPERAELTAALESPPHAEPAVPHLVPDRDAVGPHGETVPDEDDRTLITIDQLDDLSRDELRVIARQHDVTVRGSADDLRARLRPVLAPVPHQVPA